MVSLLLVFSGVVVDSAMTRAEALEPNKFPADVVERMAVVDVRYWGFDDRLHAGQIVVDQSLAKEVKEIFAEIERVKFPVRRVVPIIAYKWDDAASIRANNTSAFNYRMQIQGGRPTKRLSNHATGRAIDLNPFLNPFVTAKGKADTKYDPQVAGTLTSASPVTRVFQKYGWTWGGNWRTVKDYQHFEKK